ncbi:MAG: NupC/NupG family nucleoside CNT transporter [Candidatus Marinimicrobia bacterium]|jgi:CNT family concentrative nucleoside transporter|nr:NupC/NupG family nucleoside CNT transporter [Candidatus Neomarinimicrobiota bacterium]MBT3946362.1 NupC/NupG family nucleoside CNT transporter [Candidatus Neomarinimicrobiota bacterium]MBT4154448.1 NupC/NupG family nucleoside CNT transporter [Candidatus Neomarinimicrobiota bacterium]MBT4554634.1 NupC/NupG family nucleoside CNT transporter [Candidatus Neomarinimicrobiota bacterium]MBT4752514.1 NupC/NupG family nucleoside CNT transporter [Candidatus Neomarinimicrobiota bacterium]|tara:strand:- start:3445 stop:4665 length:1221 start_codon:yes stop_codon:yes gene_type:complete
MEKYTGLIGIVALLGIAVAISNDRSKINLRLVGWGLGIQLTFAIFILKTPLGKPIFGFLDKAISKLISFSDAGSDFLFTSFVPGVGFDVALINFAFRALPTIIFFSALMSVMYHFGVIQIVVKWIAKAMQKTMGTSGSETLSVSANIFVGQTEAPLMIRPFINTMTKSELMAVMVGGFATVAGGVLAIYVKWLTDIPGIAGHLLAASVMSAPAALVMAKIIYPETEESETMGDLKMDIEKTSSNAMEALGNGATDGLKLAANVAAMLVAFLSIVAMINFLLGFANTSIDELLGLFFQPLAWTMGVPWDESAIMGTLMGKKIAFTELIAYGDLKGIIASGQISERTAIIASYALCGFANFGSIGIQLGGIGGMAPDRKKDLAALVTKAMIGGALASWLTATIAGILI